MIREAQDRSTMTKKMFDAPGEAQFFHILNAGEFSGKGRLFSHVVLKPGCGVGNHTHKGDFEVYYILKGTATYNDNGKEVILKQGDVAVCPDGEAHGIENKGSEDLEMIALILFS